jgi:hypothetical protein
MRIDTASHLTSANVEAQTMLIRPAEFRVIEIEPEDEIESVLVALRSQSDAVILVLPEQSQAFNDPSHFAQVRQVCTPDQVSFVIPCSRIRAVGRYAQGFSFASTLDAATQLLIASNEVQERSDQQAHASSLRPATNDVPDTDERSSEDEETDLEAQASGEREMVLPHWEPDSGFPVPEHDSLTPAYKRVATRRVGLFAALVGLLIVAGAVLLPALFSAHLGLMEAKPAAPLVTTVGQVAFRSSGRLDPLSTKGLNDIVTVDLHSLSTPAAKQSYDAWLLPDQTDDHTKPLWLGRLMIAHDGRAQLTYMNPNHENLLAVYSRFAVTEESDNQTPATPSLDPKAVRYEGFIPNTPTPGDEQHYSLLSHLRHLLATDPTLQEIGLSGGLDIWLDRNAEKILEWSSAARDAQGPGAADAIHRQVIRVLDYLDGVANVYTSGDLPAGTPILVDPTVGRIGLLELSQTQVVPGFLTHVDIHLQGLISAPGHTQAQRELAIKIDTALKEDTSLLQRVHEDAVKLVRMNDAQLESNEALSLLDDMVTNANTAYTGQFDPATGGNINGIAWVHNELQGLATMPVTTPTHASSFDARRSDA